MSQIDLAKVIDFLQAKWMNRPCPMCGSDGWAVQQGMFALLELRDESTAVGNSLPKPVTSAAQVVPVVPVVCKSCGNTVLISAIVANVIAEEGKRA